MNTPCRYPQRSEDCVLHIRKKSASLHRASTVKCPGGTVTEIVRTPMPTGTPAISNEASFWPGQSKSWSMPPLR